MSPPQPALRNSSTHDAPRIAIVHDYLTQRGGAERVVLSLCRAFADAPVYTSLYDPSTTFDEFRALDVRPLWINRAAPLRARHRLALPLLPLAFGTARIDADVVLCSSSGWAHEVRTSGRKIVYCHSPAKWLYRRDDYLGTHPSRSARIGLRALDRYLRHFDRPGAATADAYCANSTFIAEQIREVYGIEAEILCPPAGLGPEGAHEAVHGIEPGFLLVVARLLPYKNVAQVVEAFRRLPRRSLVVVGDGPERETLVANAPSNITFVTDVADAGLRWLYANSAGVVAASREDFGLTALEAASFGKAVAALRWGGFLDSVEPEITGLFFDSPDPVAISEAVEELLTREWNTDAIRHHAAQFSEDRFIRRIREIVSQVSLQPQQA